MIQFLNEYPETLPIDERRVSAWIKRTAARYGRHVGRINYLFCTDERILEVNRQFLAHDYYTDIITFDYGEGDTVAGDLFISVDTVRSNAEQYGARFEDELHRVIIHGVLHLCGQDDKAPADRAEMTRKENLALEEWADMLAP